MQNHPVVAPGPGLHIGWASRSAAAFACSHWHYSRCVPGVGYNVRVGAWEDGRFIGAVIFGQGANRHIGTPYDLTAHECCELTRVALTKHSAPVSRILRIAVMKLRQRCPALRLIVSYADTARGHHGGVYQASGWTYVGAIEEPNVFVHGELLHKRSCCMKYGTAAIPWLREHVDPNAAFVDPGPKHKYLLPLDPGMREFVQPLAQPYPKREEELAA